MRSYDNHNWRVDNTDLLGLGWKPKIPFEESVERMVHVHPDTPSSLFVDLDRKYGH